MSLGAYLPTNSRPRISGFSRDGTEMRRVTAKKYEEDSAVHTFQK